MKSDNSPQRTQKNAKLKMENAKWKTREMASSLPFAFLILHFAFSGVLCGESALFCLPVETTLKSPDECKTKGECF
jgi:hypothetical protein